MASAEPEVAKAATQPAPPALARGVNCSVVDVALRTVLCAATLVALVVMVTSEQSVLAPQPDAKFQHSPAFIYFVAAMSVSCFYSIITTLASISVILKPAFQTKFSLHFAFWDVLMLGVVASATGAAGGVAYIGLKGNKHLKWNKICPTYDKFCRHVGSSIFVALFAAVLLVLLSMLSTYSLYKRIPK